MPPEARPGASGGSPARPWRLDDGVSLPGQALPGAGRRAAEPERCSGSDEETQGQRASDARGKHSTGQKPASRRSSAGVSDSDPRRYLMRRQRSQGGRAQGRRLPSTRLPLEVVPREAETHGMTTRLGWGASEVRRQVERLAAADAYVRGGGLEGGLSFADTTQAALAEERLRARVDSWLTKGGGRAGTARKMQFTMRAEARGKRR